MVYPAWQKLTFDEDKGCNALIHHPVKLAPTSPAEFVAEHYGMRLVRVKVGTLPKHPGQVLWETWRKHPGIFGYTVQGLRFDTAVYLELMLQREESVSFDAQFNVVWPSGYHLLPTFLEVPLPPSIPWEDPNGILYSTMRSSSPANARGVRCVVAATPLVPTNNRTTL